MILLKVPKGVEPAYIISLNAISYNFKDGDIKILRPQTRRLPGTKNWILRMVTRLSKNVISDEGIYIGRKLCCLRLQSINLRCRLYQFLGHIKK